MIILVFGEDGLRVKRKVDELVLKFKEKFDASGINIAQFIFKDNEAEIKSAVGTLPFLARRRMIVIEGLGDAITRKDDAEAWAKALVGKGEDTIVVLKDTVPKEKGATNKLYVALRASEKVHEYVFGMFEDAEARAWVVAKARELGSEWGDGAVRALVEITGNDSWRLENAFLKVHSSVDGVVNQKNVEEIVSRSPEDVVFMLLDAVRAKQAPRALSLLQSELLRGTEPGLLINLIAKDVRNLAELWALKKTDGQNVEKIAAATLGIHPFVVKKTLPRASRLTAKEAEDMMKAVTDADRLLKTSSASEQEALEMLVLRLVS